MGPHGEVHDGMLIERDVSIAMDDGLVLRADVYRPPDEGRYPVIVSHGPYAKGLAFQEGYRDQWENMVAGHPEIAAGSTNKYQNWEVVDPEKWVPEGYACVRVDSRGAGRSPGYLDPFSERETRDLYDCIEWAGTREWSNGKVGLNGISYYAMNQWHVAALQPPHLAAICPWEGAADWYREMTHHGGIPSSFFALWYPQQVTIVQHGVGEHGPSDPNTGELVAGPETITADELERNRIDLAEAVRAHPCDDEFTRKRSPDWSKVTVPLLSCANWGGQGLHPRGNFEGFMRAASEQKWLEGHGLEHWTHFYTDYGRNLQKRFFDHFLKGEDNGWPDTPRVLLQVRHADGRFVERGEGEWPIARTRWTRLYVDATDSTLRPDPADRQGAVEYEPLNSEGVTFTTPPLDEDMEITGPVAAKLFVSSATTDADLFLVLRVFAPDGEEVLFSGTLDPHTPVGQGWLRASHRRLDPDLTREYRPYHTHDKADPLVPGEVYELDIEIWPTCIAIPAGYRVALTVCGKDYEYDGEPVRLGWLSMRGCGPFLHDDPQGRPPEVYGRPVTIHTGPTRGGYVLLPVVPRSGM